MNLSRQRSDSMAVVLALVLPGWSLPSPADIDAMPTLRVDNYIEIIDSVLDPATFIGITRDAPALTRQVLIMTPGDPGTLATRATQADDEPLVITTTVPFTPDGSVAWPLPEGHVSIVAADGSRIELRASADDRRSVDITIISGGRRHAFRHDWSTWSMQ